MQHPEEGLIHAWIDGALPAAEAAELEAHVAQCSECAAAVAEARGLVAASSRIIGHLDAVPANVIPASPKHGRSWTRAAWPTAIAATLIFGITIARDRQTDSAVDPVMNVSTIGPQTVPDSARLAVPQPSVSTNATGGGASVPPAANAGRVAQQKRPQPEVRAMAANEPPISELQKVGAAAVAPPPPAAPVVGSVGGSARSAGASDLRLRGALSEVVVTGTVDSATRAAVDREDLRAQRARTMAPSAASAASAQMERRRDMVDSPVNPAVAAFVGCYEMGVSTDILPSRFALVADSSSVLPGLMGVRYLDSQGGLSDRIVDAGWTVEGNTAVIRLPGRGIIMTLTKTGSAVSASSPNGLRSGRVASCR